MFLFFLVEQVPARAGGVLKTEMLIGFCRDHAASRCPGHVALLNQIGFKHVLNGTTLFGQRSRNALYANRPTIELFVNCFQQASVHDFKAPLINPQ